MARDSASDGVRECFDWLKLGNQQGSLKTMTQELAMEAVRPLNSNILSDTLNVGAVWDEYSKSDQLTSLRFWNILPRC